MNNILTKKNMENIEITATMSPFAVRFEEEAELVPFPEKLIYLSRFSVSETEKEVLLAIDSLMVATSVQIMAMLADKPEITKKKISAALNRLYKGGYVYKLQFRSNGACSSFKVFVISSARGSALFRSIFDRYPVKNRYAESISDPTKLKKYLAANQLISQVKGVESSEMAQFYKKKAFLFPEVRISVHGRFTVNGKDYFCEVARREEDYKEKATARFKTLKKIISSYKNVSPVLTEKPTLIILCEDEEHRAEMMKIASKYFRSSDDVLFSYDLALTEEFDKAFTTYAIEEGKEKMSA